MNRKLALLIGMLAFFGMKMTAQDHQYGIYLGINGCIMNINSDLYYDDSESFMTIHGADTTVHYLPINNEKVTAMTPAFTIGGYYEVPVSESIGLQLHLIYNRYGYTIEGKVDQPDVNGSSTVEYDYKGELKMSNICASLLLKFDVPIEHLSIQAGITPSICIRAQKQVERGALHKTLNYKSGDDYNLFNVCGTIGITYYFFDSIMFSVTGNIGLTDVLKAKTPYYDRIDGTLKEQYSYSDTKSRTNSVALTVGYRF